MNQPWYLTIAINLIPSLIIAIVTALLTVKLSLRKFYKERWWEKKVDTYSRIVDALHNYKNYNEQKLKIEMSHPNSGEEKKLEKQWEDADAELQRAIDLGAFVISEEAEEIIKKFLNRQIGDPNYEPLVDIIEYDLVQVKKCLSAVKKTAKNDLNL